MVLQQIDFVYLQTAQRFLQLTCGFFARPARFSNEKFCMLRAPIWITSAYFSTKSNDSLSMASVTMPRPNSSRTLARISSPLSASP